MYQRFFYEKKDGKYFIKVAKNNWKMVSIIWNYIGKRGKMVTKYGTVLRKICQEPQFLKELWDNRIKIPTKGKMAKKGGYEQKLFHFIFVRSNLQNIIWGTV